MGEKMKNFDKTETITSDKPSEIEAQNIDNFQKQVSGIKERLNNIDETKLNPEQKNRFIKIKEKIENSTKKLFKTIKWVVLIVGVLEIAQYKRTHIKLDISEQQTGEKRYKHPDQRTTHLLNVLSGREKLTEEDMRFEYNSLIREISKQTEQKFDKDPADMTMDELDEAVFLYLSKTDTIIKRGDFKKDILKEIERYSTPDTNSQYKPSNDIYDLVWQMEEECGSPKIRFNSENMHFTPVKGYQGNLHYDPFSNTIFVTPHDISPNSEYFERNELIAELSHGKQFKEQPLGSVMQFSSDVVSVFSKSGFNKDSINEAYRNLYNKKGSFENDGHGVIEPYLENKYKLFIKK